MSDPTVNVTRADHGRPRPRGRRWLIFVVAAASGLVLAISTFSPWPVLQLASLFALIPVLALMLSGDTVEGRWPYLVGVVFFGAWLLPTTYWYYSFMHPLVAVAASVGFVLLMSNLFHLFTLRGRLPPTVILVIFCVAWAGFTFVRLRVPVMEDWWIPHLGYAIWRNPAVLQVGRFAGEASIEFGVLAFSSACALLIIHKKSLVALAAAVVAVGVVLVGNGVLAQAAAAHMRDLPIIITLQSSTPKPDVDATVQVIEKLQTQTRDALHEVDRSGGQEVYVVWPENRIPPTQPTSLPAFAKASGINLVYHSYEPSAHAGKPYKIIVWIGADGRSVLQNSKQHIAPGEEGTARESANIHEGISAFICYDVHYPDIVTRMHGAGLVFVALNDEDFFDLEKTFHLADMALRATQARTWIAASSKDGPTAVVSPEGVVVRSLPYHQDAVIIIQ